MTITTDQWLNLARAIIDDAQEAERANGNAAKELTTATVGATIEIMVSRSELTDHEIAGVLMCLATKIMVVSTLHNKGLAQ